MRKTPLWNMQTSTTMGSPQPTSAKPSRPTRPASPCRWGRPYPSTTLMQESWWIARQNLARIPYPGIPRATRSSIFTRHALEDTVPNEDQTISRKRPRVTQTCSLPTGPIRNFFRPIPTNLSLRNEFNEEIAQEQSIVLDQNCEESQQDRAISGERPINPRTQVRTASQSH